MAIRIGSLVVVVLKLTNSSAEAGGTGVGSALGCSSFRFEMTGHREKVERNQ